MQLLVGFDDCYEDMLLVGIFQHDMFNVSIWQYKLTFGSARALITFPRARSERLMLAPSRSRAPLALVALALSEPARSIRLILATQTFGLRQAVLSCCLKYICRKEYKTSIEKKTVKKQVVMHC